MTDIVKRLRNAHPSSLQYVIGSMILAEAADEIETLRQRVVELEANEQAYERIIGPKSHQEVAGEFEILRQRVKELATAYALERKLFNRRDEQVELLKTELAALKAEMKMDAEGPDWIQRAMQAEAKLECLELDKAQQGEPVAKVVFDCRYDREKLISKTNPQIFRLANEAILMELEPDTPLYTSAPTIPESVVTLQSGSDGVWAHFRVGKGYAFSYNLDTDKMGKRFAEEYRAMLAAAPMYTKERNA